MTEVDELWLRACAQDKQAFGDWAGRVERPVRRSLERFARAIDVEGVVQETLLRMWELARGHEITLTGENASQRYARTLAYNLARNLARRHRRETLLPPDELPEDPAATPLAPPRDPFLLLHIRDCLAALKGKLKRAMTARLEHGHRPDDVVAGMLKMKKNTFLQNIVRARKQVDECLATKGVHEHEELR
jgi:DNA-directed RNA polymerase specialized sigma24 family protein